MRMGWWLPQCQTYLLLHLGSDFENFLAKIFAMSGCAEILMDFPRFVMDFPCVLFISKCKSTNLVNKPTTLVFVKFYRNQLG